MNDTDNNGEGQINEGHDPTEEVGPEGSEVSPAECDIPPTEGGQQHEQVSFIEELGEGYTPEDIAVAIHPDDGLPFTPDAYQELATAPAFTYENMVCVEDAREFEEVFEEELDSVTANTIEEHESNGKYCFFLSSKYTAGGSEIKRQNFNPSSVVTVFGIHVANRGIAKNQITYVPVRPVRPKCIHYKRQVFLNDDQPDPNEPGHKIIFRNCAIRNSVGGASMSLRDQAVLACDWRSPPDLKTTKRHLDLFDEEKLSGDAHTKKIPLFGNRES